MSIPVQAEMVSLTIPLRLAARGVDVPQGILDAVPHGDIEVVSAWVDAYFKPLVQPCNMDGIAPCDWRAFANAKGKADGTIFLNGYKAGVNREEIHKSLQAQAVRYMRAGDPLERTMRYSQMGVSFRNIWRIAKACPGVNAWREEFQSAPRVHGEQLVCMMVLSPKERFMVRPENAHRWVVRRAMDGDKVVKGVWCVFYI